MKLIAIFFIMLLADAVNAQPALVYSNQLDCTYTISGKEIVDAYSGKADLTIEINRTDKRLHATAKLTIVEFVKSITIDSSGQLENPVTYTDKAISYFGGGSSYTTNLELDRVTGSFSVTESKRIDPFAGANWSTVTYSGTCAGKHF